MDRVAERLPVYDEMRRQSGEISAAYRSYATWLANTPMERLCRRKKEAELLFTRLGITFAVYGEETGVERLIPFDVIPRILSQAEWDTL
ncbi:MAG: hypothetical protein ACRD3R_10085 [Terriglobales bacterium]